MDSRIEDERNPPIDDKTSRTNVCHFVSLPAHSLGSLSTFNFRHCATSVNIFQILPPPPVSGSVTVGVELFYY